MTSIRSLAGKSRIHWLQAAAAIILAAGVATTATSQPPPIVGTSTDSQHTFLTSNTYPGITETPFTSQAYYQAIDPGGKKVDFRDWLVNAGFISDRSQWRSTGQQIYTSTPGDYGPNKINAYAHFIFLNASDLGFIRNQYIRCNPDCKTKGAKIYTYLENYLPQQVDSNGVVQDRNGNAVNIAQERRTGRLADVAFEWAPAADGSSPTTLFGQLYSFVVHAYTDGLCGAGNPILNSDGTQKIDELYTWPNDQQFWDCKINLRSATTLPPDFLDPRPDFTVYDGQMFAPELDRLGTKMHPGVCFICHGGTPPSTVQNTLVWPNNGNTQDFRMLPADADNGIFGVNDIGAPLVPGAGGRNLTRTGQEVELKKYNQIIAITQGATVPKNAIFAPDGTIAGGNWTVPTSRSGGTKRPSHGLEVIFGWYAGFAGDLSMSASVQDNTFIPVGWRTTAEAQKLYLKVVAPSCRSCHMNREQSLDFGTAAQFDSNKGNIQDFVFQPECDALLNEVTGGKHVMPLARLTWDRFWQGVDPATNRVYDPNTLAANDPNAPAFILKQHFGYTATSFCASKH